MLSFKPAFSLVTFPGGSHSPGPETCCRPYNFATVWELLWYNCSPVYGLPSWQLFCEADDNLLQEDLCHMPCLPGRLLPEPRSLLWATTDLCLFRRHSTLKGWSGSVSYGGQCSFLWVLMHTRFCLHAPNISGGYGV